MIGTFSVERMQRAFDLLRDAIGTAAAEGIPHPEIHAALVAAVEASGRAIDGCRGE